MAYIETSKLYNYLDNTRNISKGKLMHFIDSNKIADVVEVKHGVWLDNIEKGGTVAGITGEFNVGYKCSLCGRFEMRKEPYCNCGAKMDGVKIKNDFKE